MTRELQRMKVQLCPEFSRDKILLRNPKSKLTAYTRPTPEYLARNHFLWPRFSHSMRASLMLLKLSRSCPKRILGNSAIPWQGKAPDSHFIVFFISVGPPSPTSKITHRLKVLAFKTCPDCVSRSWNSIVHRKARETTSLVNRHVYNRGFWASQSAWNHLSPLSETRPDTHVSYVTFMPIKSTEMSIASKKTNKTKTKQEKKQHVNSFLVG